MGIQYPDVCPMQLDKDGGYYCRHVAAMTDEALYRKSDIAEQLGWRDREIDRLRAELAAKSKDAERYRWLRDVAHPDSEATSLHVSYERVNGWGNWYSEHAAGKFLDGSIDNAIKAMGDGHDTDA